MSDGIKISVTLPVKLVAAINEMQKQEMKSCSAIVSEAVRMYYAKRRMIFTGWTCLLRVKKLVYWI